MGRSVILAMTILAGCAPAKAAGGRPAGQPLLLELFTSQGCSSCPPADRLLGELGGDPGVIALAYHVDYWDDLGWKDPFSSPSWSERQGQYARIFAGRGLYTPQLVAGGVAEAVGSDRARVAELVAAAGASPVQVTLEATREGGTIRVRAATTPALRAGDVMMLAVAESGLTTAVARGENAGRRLQADHIVRMLSEVGADGVATVSIPAGWDPSHLEVVVFVQERRSLRVLGAARRPV